MDKLANYTLIVMILLVLAYFFKGPVHKMMGGVKNILNAAMPKFNLIYI